MNWHKFWLVWAIALAVGALLCALGGIIYLMVKWGWTLPFILGVWFLVYVFGFAIAYGLSPETPEQ